jgi:hypothetical protein
LFLIFEGYISDNHLFLEFKFNVYKSCRDGISVAPIYRPTNNPVGMAFGCDLYAFYYSSAPVFIAIAMRVLKHHGLLMKSPWSFTQITMVFLVNHHGDFKRVKERAKKGKSLEL